MKWQKTVLIIAVFAIAIITFLYGYAFLYDYFYSQNFPQIYISYLGGSFDPTAVSDATTGFFLELGNALQEAVS